MQTRRLRKQVYELTSEDLLDYPVWEFALDEEGEEGQDEATVRPFSYDGALDPSWGSFIIRAVFELADGTKLSGYLTPPPSGLEDEDLGLVQPCVTGPDEQVSFWWGVMERSRNEISSVYSRLGKASATEIFPICFASDVELTGGPVTGEIPGFLLLNSTNFTDVRIVT